MIKEIIVYKNNKFIGANIEQVSVKRDWMDASESNHAYQCFPITLANTLGWAISFPEDISFIWDGICDTTPDHIKILKGHKYCSTARGNATLGFNTYLTFKTDENTTTLIMPVPNKFDDRVQCYTSLITTSFYKAMLPMAWRVLKPNVEITIPAGDPVAVIVPISLSELQNFEVTIKDDPELIKEYDVEIQRNLEHMKEQYAVGKYSHLYRNAKDKDGESAGNHETKKLTLKTNR